MTTNPLPGRPARPDEDRLVYLGMLTKPQGIRGGIRLFPEFDSIEDFEDLKTQRLFLRPAPQAGLRPKPAGAFREIDLAEYEEHQRFLVLFFEGIPDATAVEPLRNQEVYVYEDEMWDLPEGKFYSYQLAGLTLIDQVTGEPAGTVKELRPGVQDYLVVTSPTGEFLVPYVPEIVEKVDLAEQRIYARLPEGITEI